MVLTILVAGLAVCGVFLVLWALTEAVLRPLPQEIYHVVPLSGSAASVEQTLRLCLRTLRGRILFVDMGLDAEAQMTAEHLLRNAPAACLCSPVQVSEFLRWENALGARAD